MPRALMSRALMPRALLFTDPTSPDHHSDDPGVACVVCPVCSRFLNPYNYRKFVTIESKDAPHEHSALCTLRAPRAHGTYCWSKIVLHGRVANRERLGEFEARRGWPHSPIAVAERWNLASIVSREVASCSSSAKPLWLWRTVPAESACVGQAD